MENERDFLYFYTQIRLLFFTRVVIISKQFPFIFPVEYGEFF